MRTVYYVKTDWLTESHVQFHTKLISFGDVLTSQNLLASAEKQNKKNTRNNSRKYTINLDKHKNYSNTITCQKHEYTVPQNKQTNDNYGLVGRFLQHPVLDWINKGKRQHTAAVIAKPYNSC